MIKLKDIDRSLLAAGNCYTFAKIFCENYKNIAKKENLSPNNYMAWVEFNKEDKLFTVWRKNNDKDFFNINFEYTGTKEY